MMAIQAVVFDLDGTLIDSRGDIARAMNEALVATGRAPLPESTIAGYVGDGARTLCARAANLEEGGAEIDELVQVFVASYAARPIERTTFYPYALEALDAASARGLRLAICTNKPRIVTDVILEMLGISGRFQAIVAGGDTPQKKPSPEPLCRVAELLRMPSNKMVMVGDGLQDVLAAKAFGARSIAVTYGFTSRERLTACGPDVLLDSLTELDAWTSA